MSATTRLGLELVESGQAQKEVSVNESLTRLDLLVGGAVEEVLRNAPPASPVAGQCWIVGTSPTGSWAGKAGYIAGYTVGGWRMVPPVEGLSLLVRTTGTFATYRGGSWQVGEMHAAAFKVGGNQVVGARGAAIPSPAGGAVVDSEARTSLTAVLAALRNHGLIAT